MLRTMNPVATRIQARLEALGMTRAELARAAKVPYHRINPWFSRENAKPEAKTLEAVARALNVTTGHLLHGEPVNDVTARERVMRAYDRLTPEGLSEMEAFAQFLLTRDPPPTEEEG